jgi:hypothetical protein
VTKTLPHPSIKAGPSQLQVKVEPRRRESRGGFSHLSHFLKVLVIEDQLLQSHTKQGATESAIAAAATAIQSHCLSAFDGVMTPATAKRAKVSHSPIATQTNLKDLFAKQQTSPIKARPVALSTEDEELKWAIQESLKEQVSIPSALEAKEIPDIQQQDGQKETLRPIATPTLQPLVKRGIDGEEGEQSSGSSISKQPKETAKTSGGQFNAFSRLMSSHSEAKEWAAVDVSESRNPTTRYRQRGRSAPFYKILTGMPICVDGFRFGAIPGCNAYFLSHFHADHYGGITSSWDAGPIYCSQTTANLVRTSLHVQPHLICPLPFDIPTTVPNTGGVQVTLLDANHCPGSSLFLFEGPQTCHILPPPAGSTRPAIPPPFITFRYLHCGDFRASPRHTNHPMIKGKRLDIIYLDTTYCNPRYCFPAQEMVINACADMVRRAAPEQCRVGSLKAEEEEPDWRVSPLKGKKLKEAMEAELNKPSVDAMKGWLESGKSPVKEEDFDLGDLDFKDEEIDFKGEDQMGDVEDDFEEGETLESAQECLDGQAPNEDVITVKKEYEEEEDFLLEEDEAAGLSARDKVEDERTESIVKKEEEGQKVKKEVELSPSSPRILVVVGTYTIGKEKIVIACAKALGTRVFCADPRKYSVYAQLEDAELHSLLTRDPLKANVHVTSLMTINGDALKEHTSRMRAMGMRIDRAIAFRPTGWTYQPPAGADLVSPSLDRVIAWNQSRQFSWMNFNPTRDSTKEYSIYGVPYSEHSSFFELSAFALSVDFVRIIATVNVGNPTSRNKMARWFEKWKAEKKRRNYKPVDARTADYF